jgi:hypothetical protein
LIQSDDTKAIQKYPGGKDAAMNHSVLKWLQGILTDLGIGFGWAVAYFYVRIYQLEYQRSNYWKKPYWAKVVQLNNYTVITVAGAFGRQGVVSAGFATSLLGFLQIYWDPDRQAIRGGVANTLVLQELDCAKSECENLIALAQERALNCVIRFQ